MRESVEKANDDLQRMSKDNYDTMLRSYGELMPPTPSSSWLVPRRSSKPWNPVSICQEGLRGLDGAGIKAHRDVRRHGAGRLQASWEGGEKERGL